MRWIPCVAVAATLPIPAVVLAQPVTVGGWVDRVDTTNSTITIRTQANPRTIQIAPNVTVRLNNAAIRLDQIPADGEVSIIAERGPTGVLQATQINVRSTGRQPAAVAPAGSFVRGTLVGINVPNNTITVRTASGDFNVPLGTAPIVRNGVRASTRDLQTGQAVQVERNLPTTASTQYVTQMVSILPEVASRPSAALRRSSGGPTVRTKTAGARSSYRSRKKRSRSRSASKTRTRRQVLRPEVWKGTRFQPEIIFDPVPTTVAARGDTTRMSSGGRAIVPSASAPIMNGASVVPGAAPVPGAAVLPGTAATPDTIAGPGVVIAPGTVVVPGVAAAPGAAFGSSVPAQTTTPDARQQSPSTAATGAAGLVDRGTALSSPNVGANPTAGVADPRFQSPATPGALSPTVGDPRTQSPLVPGTVAPGVAPGFFQPGATAPAGVPDPRNQAIVTPSTLR